MHEVLATEAETIDNDEEQLALLGDKHIADLQRRILATAAILTGIPVHFPKVGYFFRFTIWYIRLNRFEPSYTEFKAAQTCCAELFYHWNHWYTMEKSVDAISDSN